MSAHIQLNHIPDIVSKIEKMSTDEIDKNPGILLDLIESLYNYFSDTEALLNWKKWYLYVALSYYYYGYYDACRVSTALALSDEVSPHFFNFKKDEDFIESIELKPIIEELRKMHKEK